LVPWRSTTRFWASYRYGPPGEVRKLGMPEADVCDEMPELNWYSTPLPLSASMWGLRAFRFGWFTTCGGVVVGVTGEAGGAGTAPGVVVGGGVLVVVVGPAAPPEPSRASRVRAHTAATIPTPQRADRITRGGCPRGEPGPTCTHLRGTT
jgi:hypothetical protein